ncbi:ArsR/SmtB family transcription factor [Virgibacillus sp. JSM 102003]|uniref:ArsR/SmtB family transcription factor n=1 Tax=Virgibacillus sp. JSM 102003 TaxID=1562108 RepID=UPI0035C0C7D1
MFAYLSVDLINYIIYYVCNGSKVPLEGGDFNITMVSKDIFHALSEPNRRYILEILASQEQLTATDIYDRFNISPPAISQHLKILREANLVRMEKKAQQRIYQLNPDAIIELEEWANHITQLWTQRFDALDKVLEDEMKKNMEGKADQYDEPE